MFTGITRRAASTGSTAVALALFTNIGDAQGSQVFLGPSYPVPGDSYVYSVDAADLDGDGKIDFVAANNTDKLSISLGDGQGRFAPIFNISAAPETTFVSAADLNHDGTLDLVTFSTTSTNGFVGVLLNTGPGTYSPLQSFIIGHGNGLAIADFNNDGNQDVVCPFGYLNKFVGRLGDGTGGFGATFGKNTPIPPGIAVAAELNADGNIDLITNGATGAPAGAVAVFLGNGAGGFTAPTIVPIGGTLYGGVAVGDLNGDMIPDMVTASTYSISVCLGTGHGFAPHIDYSMGDGNYSIGLGDLNGDGTPDVVVTSYADYSGHLRLGDGLGGFGAQANFPVGSEPKSIHLLDINGDNKLDLLCGSYNKVYALAGVGDGTFEVAPSYPIDSNPTNSIIGDFNTDGNLDVLTGGNDSKNITVRLGNGSGALGASVISAIGASPTLAASGDLDHDGNLDIVVAVSSSNALWIGMGNGAGGFGNFTLLDVANQPIFVDVADLNADSAPDVIALTYSYIGTPLSIVFGNGNGNFAPPIVYSMGSYPIWAAVTDLNSDGIVDIVASDVNNSALVVRLGTGAGALGPPVSFSTGLFPTAIAPGDLNNDGFVDIVCINYMSEFVAAHFGDGQGNLGPVNALGIHYPYEWVAVADINTDGNLDVIATEITGVSVMIGDGAGGIQSQINYAVPHFCGYVQLGDLNGDGRLDAVTVNSGANNNTYSISVFMNQTPLAAGLALYGNGTPGCEGIHGLAATSPPFVNNPAFAVECTGAPRDSLGLCIVTDSQDFAGTDVFGLGFLLHVDFLSATAVYTFDFYSNHPGVGIVGAPIPNDPTLASQTFFMQALWIWQDCPVLASAVSSSRGLAITIQ
ncbi:MAG: VCBS repeat-containing protein [Planctomycetes bacterium]|nr:VCBS repeat-containing protein [Planctomycetota bacterium]